MDTKLSVNINKVALIRNARGGNVPNLLKVASHLEECGAQGITVHPRPDERHITYQDCYDLKKLVTTEFNIEGFPDKTWLDMVLEVKPDQATLVPDPPEALTSNTGWDTIKHQEFLQEVIRKLNLEGIRTSIFLNPQPELIDSAKSTGTDRIELYTGPFADLLEDLSSQNIEIASNSAYQKLISSYQQTALEAENANLGINAGHDLNTFNLPFLKYAIPQLAEVSIGQALISDALFNGFQTTVRQYLDALQPK